MKKFLFIATAAALGVAFNTASAALPDPLELSGGASETIAETETIDIVTMTGAGTTLEFEDKGTLNVGTSFRVTGNANDIQVPVSSSANAPTIRLNGETATVAGQAITFTNTMAVNNASGGTATLNANFSHEGPGNTGLVATGSNDLTINGTISNANAVMGIANLIDSGGKLILNGTLNGTGTAAQGFMFTGSAGYYTVVNATFSDKVLYIRGSGTVELTSTASAGVNNQTINLQAGSNTLLLTGSASTTGAINLAHGTTTAYNTLQVKDNAAATGTITLQNYAKLQVDTNARVGAIDMTGIDSSAHITGSSSGQIRLWSNAALHVIGTATGNIAMQAGYTGTVLIDGTASGTITTVSGGTLGGSGTIGTSATATTVVDGAFLNRQGLTFNRGLTMVSGATLNVMSLGDADAIKMNAGALTLNSGLNIKLFDISAAPEGMQWVLDADPTARIVLFAIDGGTFVGGQGTLDAMTANFLDADGNVIAALDGAKLQWEGTSQANGIIYIQGLKLVAIPEPSTWLLLGTGAALLVIFRRRKASR